MHSHCVKVKETGLFKDIFFLSFYPPPVQCVLQITLHWMPTTPSEVAIKTGLFSLRLPRQLFSYMLPPTGTIPFCLCLHTSILSGHPCGYLMLPDVLSDRTPVFFLRDSFIALTSHSTCQSRAVTDLCMRKSLTALPPLYTSPSVSFGYFHQQATLYYFARSTVPQLLSALLCNTPYALYQCWPTELSAMTETVYICTKITATSHVWQRNSLQ